MLRRVLKIGALVAGGLFLLIQLVPYGRDHDNRPVTAEPDWGSPAALRLARAACYDCHSNETEWPWYSNVAPMSWFVQHDVDEGRDALNFSEWDGEQELDDLVEVVEEGEMPPLSYRILHAGARLSGAERALLIDALGRIAGSGGDSSGHGSGDAGSEDSSGHGSASGAGRG
jgi:hypothetical protein